MDALLGIIPSVLMIVAPILIAAMGGMICERSGVVNIALEGLMAIGAFVAAAAHVITENSPLGERFPEGELGLALLLGALFAMALSSIHAYASVSLNSNQIISGTGINLLSGGITIFAAQILFSADRTPPYQLGMLPGPLNIYPTAMIALAVVLLSHFVLYKLPFGRHLRACGENPHAAASVGLSVQRIRYIAVLCSGFLSGLAGACLVLTQTIQYTSNTINGAGFIALAAVSFGRWNPLGIAGASLLFGSAVALALYVVNIPLLRNMLPSEFFSLFPFVITLLALIVFSGKNYAPRSIGRPYQPETSS